MLNVRRVHVSDSTGDYTYQDSEEAFPFLFFFYINLLDHDELNPDYV